jgi:LuxR family maltose regulon positive regulatory protein
LGDACRAAHASPAADEPITVEPPSAEPPSRPASGTLDPVERLSGRELEVLRMLDTELDGPQIAQHLFVSLNTVRTHTKNIYAKLGVNSRRAAVRRGRELGLLTAR